MKLSDQILAFHTFATITPVSECFLKVPDGDRAMKSEFINARDPTAIKGDFWGWRKQ